MKVFTAILAASFALLCLGCGGNDTTTVSDEKGAEAPAGSDRQDRGFPTVSERDDPRFATLSSGGGRRAQLEIDPSHRPPPKRFLVRDIKVGAGPVARPGDRAAVWYIGVDYKTGERQFQAWPPVAPRPFVVQLRPPGIAEAWEVGIMGMRAGGRREMLIPSRLAFGNGALDYVFDLVRLESPPPPGDG
jgi:peptidylprolyl isomerase